MNIRPYDKHFLNNDIRPNVRCSVLLQMQCMAARLSSSLTLRSMTAITAIDCSSYVPTFGLLSKLLMTQ